MDYLTKLIDIVIQLNQTEQRLVLRFAKRLLEREKRKRERDKRG